jgi:squalene-hopene/tetraprenyl-beta-curcumene cyclase
MTIDSDRLEHACQAARDKLLQQRQGQGHWTGWLATSALSTATAVSALSLVDRSSPGTARADSRRDAAGELPSLIRRGTRWLIANQNNDGGWGDTDRSHSNIATTMLCQAAIHLAGEAESQRDVLARAERYTQDRDGISGLRRRYGRDKTFAVPILANCALAGIVPWKEVSPLPFELACLPQSWYRFAQLPVVSYAIPALVAIGQARFLKNSPWFAPLKWLRQAAIGPSLRVLRKIQPESGGYLEAIPLTSFVVMSLAGTGRADNAVVLSGVEFLRQSVRDDGSWPIDTNLATWNTSLAIRALAVAGEDVGQLECWDWLISCQNRTVHPFTGAKPGGWGWSDLSGAVPDADDTPAAILALAAWRDSPSFREGDLPRVHEAVGLGLRWLLDLQNRDGGWPTFCRGWGKLPFDRSGCDLTAHALRAFRAWQPEIEQGRFHSSGISAARGRLAVERGYHYLDRQQREDGSWLPLWFGNQDHAEEENPVYGTAKVLMAYLEDERDLDLPARAGIGWLLRAQNPDGGWGGGWMGGKPVSSSSMEETALAVETLGLAVERRFVPGGDIATDRLETVFERGVEWLIRQVEADRLTEVAPIGFYFAKLWYYETLYPITFGLGALGQVTRAVRERSSSLDPSPAGAA